MNNISNIYLWIYWLIYLLSVIFSKFSYIAILKF